MARYLRNRGVSTPRRAADLEIGDPAFVAAGGASADLRPFLLSSHQVFAMVTNKSLFTALRVPRHGFFDVGWALFGNRQTRSFFRGVRGKKNTRQLRWLAVRSCQ